MVEKFPINYRYHKNFSFLSLCCFGAILCFFGWRWLFHHTYKNYYYSHELQEFVGETTSIKKYPFQSPQTILNTIIFEYSRGPIDPFLRNPLSGKGRILLAIFSKDRLIVNLSSELLENIKNSWEEEQILGAILLTLQSSSVLQNYASTVSFVFAGELVTNIHGSINLYRPISLKNWRPQQIPLASTWPMIRAK